MEIKMEINKHEINKKRIQNYMGKKNIPHDFRLEMVTGGGQYLDNFLLDFATFVQNETINEIVVDLKSKRKL